MDKWELPSSQPINWLLLCSEKGNYCQFKNIWCHRGFKLREREEWWGFYMRRSWEGGKTRFLTQRWPTSSQRDKLGVPQGTASCPECGKSKQGMGWSNLKATTGAEYLGTRLQFYLVKAPFGEPNCMEEQRKKWIQKTGFHRPADHLWASSSNPSFLIKGNHFYLWE